MRDRPCDKDLGAEPSGLPKRPAGELVTGHPVREAEVVLDLGGRAGLAAGRLALDDERAEPLGGAVHGGGEPRRPRPDDDDVVLRRLRLGWELEELRDPTELRLHDRPVVEVEHVGDLPEVRAHDDPGLEDANGRKLVGGRKGLAPLLDGILGLGRDPVVGDVVPVEEASDVGTGRVPLRAEHDRAARRPVDGEPGQPPRALDPVDREAAHLGRHVRSHRSDRVVVARVEPHHPRWLDRAKPDREDGAERDGHLPEHLAGHTLPDRALDPVDDLDGLDASLDEPEERLLAALVRRVLARWRA